LRHELAIGLLCPCPIWVKLLQQPACRKKRQAFGKSGSGSVTTPWPVLCCANHPCADGVKNNVA
jgi:hypothetical protein